MVSKGKFKFSVGVEFNINKIFQLLKIIRKKE